MKENFLVAVQDIIRMTIYSYNLPLIPDSATITLYKPNGDVLQASASATVNATTGEMTYTLTTTHTALTGLNYKAVWAYTISGTTYYETQLFDIVKSMLSIPIIDEDLFRELESLRATAYQAKGTATAGAVGSITDTKLNYVNSFWKGGTISIVSGTGIGQKRDISGFTQATGVITVTPNWTTTPDTTSVYVITTSYANKIQSAFNTICTMLYNKGKRQSLILESSQIFLPVLYMTIHIIALDLMDEERDKWDRIAQLYSEKFEKAFANMKLDYDEDESGAIAGDEIQASPASFTIGRS